MSQDLSSKIEELREIKAWLENPITDRFNKEMEIRRKASVLHILENTPTNEYEILLREQIIGEQRGQDLLRVLVQERIAELDSAIADGLKYPTD